MDTIYPATQRSPFQFHEDHPSQFIAQKQVTKKKIPFKTFLPKTNVVAFMVIKNDSIIYEYYKPNYDRYKTYTSFSLAKSFMSALIGIAIDEKKIQNVNDPITKYLPELNSKKGFDQLTLKHLLEHRSGLNYRDYKLGRYAGLANLFYGKDLTKVLTSLKLKDRPGESYRYLNVNTVLLGMALERATQKRLPIYLQEKLWEKLDMEQPLTWSKDDVGNTKSFCCMQGQLLDFAKFGRLYLNGGIYNSDTLISKKWIDESTKPDLDGTGQQEPYHWQSSGQWTHPSTFNARGMYDQFILINPTKKVLILQFCDKTLKAPPIFWRLFYENLSNEL